MRRQPTLQTENQLRLALDEVERLKASLARISDGMGLVITTPTSGSGPADGPPTTPGAGVEPLPHVLYGSKHTRSFRVTDGGGLLVNYEQGQIWMSDIFYAIAAGSLTLTDDATNYVFVNDAGAVAFNTTGFPGDCWPIALVTTVAGDITALVDRRSYAAGGAHAGAGSVVASGVSLPVIGTPTYDDVEDMQTTMHSVGWINGGTISDAGGATIDVGAGAGLIRASDSRTAQLLFFDWSASAGLAIAADSIRYIGVEYNFGAPQVTARATNNWNYNTDFPLGIVVNEGGTLHIQQHEHAIGDHANFMIQRMHQAVHIQRDNELNGNILGESADTNRYVTVSAGAYWIALNRFTTVALDTAPGPGDTFDTYSAGGQEAAGVTQWPNTQYDNGGVLTNMTANRWANLWWYQELDGELVMVYGTAQYTTEGRAEAEAVPTILPDRAVIHARLIGRMLFQKSAGTAAQVLTAFATTFATTGVTDHGGLVGLGDDDHTQYALLAGRSAGQTLYGGPDAGDSLYLISTSHATKGDVYLGGGVMIPGHEAAVELVGADWTPGPGSIGIGEVGADLYVESPNDLIFVIDAGGGGANNFRWYHGATLAAGTLVMQLVEAGQLQLPISGSGAGILIGGDVQLYRAAANLGAFPSGDALALLGGAGDFGAPVDGTIWYNTTTKRFRGYEDGAWVNLSAGAGGGSLPAYAIINESVDRAFDANAITLHELADVVATLINDVATLHP